MSEEIYTISRKIRHGQTITHVVLDSDGFIFFKQNAHEVCFPIEVATELIEQIYSVIGEHILPESMQGEDE